MFNHEMALGVAPERLVAGTQSAAWVPQGIVRAAPTRSRSRGAWIRLIAARPKKNRQSVTIMMLSCIIIIYHVVIERSVV